MVAAVKEMAPAMLQAEVDQPGADEGHERGLHRPDRAATPRPSRAVVAGDIGGAFGAKTVVHREDVAVCAAALELGRSVKWVEDRNEHLTVGAQAREESVEVAVAVRHDGTILGMRARMTMDGGAYPGLPLRRRRCSPG